MNKIFVFAFSTLITQSAVAQSHCQPNEFVLFSCKFGKLSGNTFVGSKVMSFCADKKDMSRLDYRYGQLGKIEFQRSSPKDGNFLITSKEISERASLDVIYFSNGNYTYAITECNGMHCGWRTYDLLVFDGVKRIAAMRAEPEKCIINGGFDIKNKMLATKKISPLNFNAEGSNDEASFFNSMPSSITVTGTWKCDISFDGSQSRTSGTVSFSPLSWKTPGGSKGYYNLSDKTISGQIEGASYEGRFEKINPEKIEYYLANKIMKSTWICARVSNQETQFKNKSNSGQNQAASSNSPQQQKGCRQPLVQSGGIGGLSSQDLLAEARARQQGNCYEPKTPQQKHHDMICNALKNNLDQTRSRYGDTHTDKILYEMKKNGCT